MKCRFLLGNCQTFQLSLNNFFLCFPLQLTVPLSLHLIDHDHVILKVLTLLIFNTHCEFSVFFFFFNIKFIFGLCSICVWVMGKQWKRGRKVILISGFFVFSCFYVWIFPLVAVVRLSKKKKKVQVAVACFLISVWKS